jgi:hypothetical protein
MKSLTQTQLGWRVTKDEQKKLQEKILKEMEKAKKNQANYDKKLATEKKAAEAGLQLSTKNRFEILAEEKPKTIAKANTNPAKSNEEDRENWFYTADEVYLDAPFRLQDYKEKLESGSVKEAPSCEPYRKLYFLHLNRLAAENQPKNEKKKARVMFINLYSQKMLPFVKLQKNLAKKERELRKESNTKIKDAERRRDREIKAKQESIQRLSVFLPPLPLLIIAFVVFYRKKKAEIQGAYSSSVRS